MGSFVEINDTLQITREQGFPEELLLGQTYSFHSKNGIRFYHQPPVRCFLAKNTGTEWIYYGHIFIQSITHDYIENKTSGTYKLVNLFTPDEMKQAPNFLEYRE